MSLGMSVRASRWHCIWGHLGANTAHGHYRPTTLRQVRGEAPAFFKPDVARKDPPQGPVTVFGEQPTGFSIQGHRNAQSFKGSSVRAVKLLPDYTLHNLRTSVEAAEKTPISVTTWLGKFRDFRAPGGCRSIWKLRGTSARVGRVKSCDRR